MNYVNLGRAGIRVSKVCLGAMTFGREADEETSYKIMDFFVEKGGTFIDTANAYSKGGSEEVVGRWFKKRGNRDAIVKEYAACRQAANAAARVESQKAQACALALIRADANPDGSSRDFEGLQRALRACTQAQAAK